MYICIYTQNDQNVDQSQLVLKKLRRSVESAFCRIGENHNKNLA